MKKIICLIFVMIMLFSLCACGNESWSVGNYTYKHVHISDSVDGYCATVKSWHDNEMGIELHTEEFDDIYLSEGTYILFSDANSCPYCGE